MAGAGALDPEIAEFAADQDKTFDSDFYAQPIVEQRARYHAFWRRFDAPRPPGIEVEDLSIRLPGRNLPLRIYRPLDLARPHPVIVYCHGGSWTFGGLDSHDLATSRLSAFANAAVVAVDYRLAPEHRYPAAFIDAWEALHWVIRSADRLGVDRNRIAVAGDSAGAALTAGIALLARDRGGPALLAQGLVYPMLRPMQPSGPDEHQVSGALSCYFSKPEDARDPYAMPLLASDLTNLPPAVVCAAELDVLLPDARDYAAALRKAGVDARLIVGRGLPHTFLRALHICAEAARAFEEFSRELAARL